MGYNKPITARIQHSTNKGMKVQEPLLDIGSATKKKELNYGADTSLTSGVENSKFVDLAKPLAEGADGPKAAAKKALEGGQNTLPIELQNAIKAAPGKNYKNGYYGK